MIQALKSIIGKEAVYDGEGSLNEHQTNNLGKKQNKMLEAQRNVWQKFYSARVAGL